MSFNRWLLPIVAVTVFFSVQLPTLADPKNVETPPSARYQKDQITEARFGGEQKQAFLNKAIELYKTLSEKIVGQDRVILALQERLIQFVETFGTRSGEPISLHLVGFPGTGKSDIVNVLETLGFEVYRIDAQNASVYDLMELEIKSNRNDIPPILVIEELDKATERVSGDFQKADQSQRLIGAFNEVFSDDIKKIPHEVQRAASFRQGETRTTAEENLANFSDVFIGLLNKHLHPNAIFKTKSFL